MARERSPARDEARRVWLESGGTMTAQIGRASCRERV